MHTSCYYRQQMERGLHSDRVPWLCCLLQVIVTISQGKVVFEGGKLNVVAGAGRFVPMPLHPPIFEGMDKRNELWLAEEFPYGQTPVRRQHSGASASDEL